MTQPVPEMTPYSTAVPYMGSAPTWISEEDQQRILAYQVYEQIYWNIDQTFKLVQRGSSQHPIYVPAGRTIVDTTNRYTGVGLGYGIDPELGTPNDRDSLSLALRQLFTRERWRSKYNSAKRFGLIRGDWAFHIVADPEKPEGRRLSIYSVDPGSLFQIGHPDDFEKVQGWHIIEQWVEGDDVFIKRQTYSKGPDPHDPSKDDGKIWSSQAIYELDEWWDPKASPVNRVIEPHPLPDAITALPIYHIRNFEEPGNPWGSSELRGFERLMASLNQSVTDEELALALDGLGVYATTSGPPEDDDGNPVNWRLGPGRVVELEPTDEQSVDQMFKRINGVGSVTPYTDHIKMVYDFLMEGANVPAVARGHFDVETAESGIALTIRFSPMLSKTDEKDVIIEDVLSQFYFDITTMWLPEYERQSFGEAIALPTFGDKLPTNTEGRIKEIIEMVLAKVASADWARTEIAKLRGYEFSPDEGDAIVGEAAASALASDPFAARSDAEMGGEG